MRTKVQKWGNSLAIRIPRGFAEQLGVQQDSEVDLALEKDGLVIKPTGNQQSLAKLLSRVTDENIHRELETGEPVGREVW